MATGYKNDNQRQFRYCSFITHEAGRIDVCDKY
jgi:hypothetical protein